MAKKTQVDLLVLGASFAGIEVLYQLWRRYDGKVTTAVVDRQRTHGYIPLVQERLLGRIPLETSALDTAAYVESLPHTRFVEDEVVEFSPETKTATLASGKQIRGRVVVVALGSVLKPPASIPGRERLVTHKFAGEFDEARAAVETALGGEERPDAVVVGGGITGVELAGELAHLSVSRPEGWQAPKVTLVTAGDRLVENLPKAVGAKVARILDRQGVTVHLGARLAEVTEDAVVVEVGGGSKTLPAELAFWGGGVAPAPVLEALGLPRTDDGWLSVGPSMQCFATARPTHHEIFACGDAVRIDGGRGRWPTMQRAIECLWQAKVVAKNIIQLMREKPDYPGGIPPMVPHRLRETFPYGVSLGAKSLLVTGPLRVHVPAVTPWFRRFLMRQYFDRYKPLPGP
ncbi:MAG: FAD-dependent oxidoreductase [Myxococcota bacterium]